MCGFFLKLENFTEFAHPVNDRSTNLRVLTLGIEDLFRGHCLLMQVSENLVHFVLCLEVGALLVAASNPVNSRRKRDKSATVHAIREIGFI
jgi:hypothetical protein